MLVFKVFKKLNQTWLTLYNTILRIARNFLETRENIKILTHPFYHINLGWFSWEWCKKKKKIRKKNSKWPTQKKLIFQNRQFSKIFREKGYLPNLLVSVLLCQIFVFWDKDLKFWLQLRFFEFVKMAGSDLT
jgi:hypothetical protein